MSHRFALRSVVAAISASLAMPFYQPVQAGSHPLSAVADINTLDYVVNVDWDFDAPPTQITNATQVLDRAYITSVLRVMAQSKFTMTEGRHRVGTVYVYKNALFGNNVDIRMLNTDGRSAANVAGWGNRNQTSFNHLAMSQQPESIDALGKVITHELGHYTYGLFDEYREDGKALDPLQPSAPSGVDTPKNTIMNNHLGFVSLSTPADYADTTTRQTAQARAMGLGTTGFSAWETLTRPPASDPAISQGLGRTYFEAFRGIDPNTLQLSRPTAGFDAKLNVVFVSSPVFRDVILVDRTLPKDRLDALLQAAKAMIAQAKDNVRYTVLAFPSATNGTVLGPTAATAEGRVALSAALDGITSDTTAAFDTATAFSRAQSVIATDRQVGDPATIHFLTGSEAVVPTQTVADIRTARVAVNPLGLTGATEEQKQVRRSLERRNAVGGTTASLSQLALGTGGSYNSAKNGADAAKDATKAVNEAHANPHASIAYGLSEPLKAGAAFETSFRVAGASTDGEVVASAYFDPSDAAKLAFALVAPDGKVYASGQLPTGIEFNLDAAEGTAEFFIAPALAQRSGKWTLRVSALSATTDWIGVDVAGLTRVTLSVQVVGGTVSSGSAPVLTAMLGGDKRIKGAVVTATIYDENGNVVIDHLVLADDGAAPDQRAGDGQYTLSLSNKLKAGEYFVVVQAQTNTGSRTATLGALVKGALEAEEAVDLMERVTEADFELEANAPGVIGSSAGTTPTTPTESSSGGGCTVNPLGDDAGLAILLGAAAAGLVLRRRARRTQRASGVTQV